MPEARDEFGRLRKDGEGRHDGNYNNHNGNRHPQGDDPRDHRQQGEGTLRDEEHNRGGGDQRWRQRDEQDFANRQAAGPPQRQHRDQDHEQQHDRREHNSSNNVNNNRQYYGPAHDQAEDPLHPGLVAKGQVTRIEPYGAFIDFADPKDPKLTHRGLAHISQLASQRVEQVTDVLQMKQSVYIVILEVEQERRQRRIRLSLKDIDQTTGTYKGPQLNKRSRGGGRPPPPRELQRRAKQRRDLYLDYAVDWREGSKEWNQRLAPGYLRELWSSSPEPPSSAQAAPAKKPPPKAAEEEAAASVGSSSSGSSSESSSSSDDRRRCRDRKRRRSKKGRRSRNDKSRRRRRRSSRDSESSSDDSSSSSSGSSKSASSSTSSREAKKPKIDEPKEAETVPVLNEVEMKEAEDLKQAIQATALSNEDLEGPMPLPQSNAAGGGAAEANSSQYGGALLPGEGQAIAQFVQQNLRIPRRGEIGYSGGDIDHYEKSGYVMSGSRHARMNAVRIRKENQVYSAEEQRALALITMEENQQKETQLMEDFRVMLKDKKKMREKSKG